MSRPNGCNQNILWRRTGVRRYSARMHNDRDRVISVSLTEAEWQAFVARHPQPVHWLREQILGQLRDLRSPEAGDRGAGASGVARV